MINTTWVLHCIDYLIRFSAAHVLKNNSAEETIEKFSLIWISVFDPPDNILSDNGYEFSNPKMQNLCCSFNITQKFTSAEAPFSNGIYERHNALIGEMTKKSSKQPEMPSQYSTSLGDSRKEFPFKYIRILTVSVGVWT